MNGVDMKAVEKNSLQVFFLWGGHSFEAIFYMSCSTESSEYFPLLVASVLRACWLIKGGRLLGYRTLLCPLLQTSNTAQGKAQLMGMSLSYYYFLALGFRLTALWKRFLLEAGCSK